MRYQSTRDHSISITGSEAIVQGLSRDGGLFVPETLPKLSEKELERLVGMTYRERAAFILGLFLDDFTVSELASFTEKAYGDLFSDSDIAPLRQYRDGAFFLELWHGPTCAFKDMALQIMPYLLTASLEKTGEDREACILVATSGDTGKAALEGFRDVLGTKIMVFYPKDGVSDIQRLQMTTQEGGNVAVCSVEGNFDDAQTGVKTIFSDEKLRETLSDRGYFLSSANSINWGRLMPQIVYYVSAYCDLLAKQSIKPGDKVNFCVPTGNFGNILAGFYAKRMGLPVGKLICASNSNDVLTDFIKTGIYNKNRDFFTTLSPSMDILVSSNLERLIFEYSGKDAVLTAGYMDALSKTGQYEISPAIKAEIARDFVCGACSDEETKSAIKEVFEKYGYLMDTHTAVAYHVLKNLDETEDDAVSVIISTASPYKFAGSVLEALGESADMDGFSMIERLSEVTGTKAPESLASLRGKAPRFDACVGQDEMKAVVERFLK